MRAYSLRSIIFLMASAISVSDGLCWADTINIISCERRVNASIFPASEQMLTDVVGQWDEDVDVLDGHLYASAGQSSYVGTDQITGEGGVHLLAFQSGYPMLIASSEMTALFFVVEDQLFRIYGHLARDHGGGNLRIELTSTKDEVLTILGPSILDETILLSSGSYELRAYAYDSVSPTTTFDRTMEWSVTLGAIPEPGSLVLLALGSLGLLGHQRKVWRLTACHT